jgi:transcriptional regulator with XRE-family HTH domain
MNTIWYDKPEEDPFYIALGVAVKTRRLALGLTQDQLAKAAGISRSCCRMRGYPVLGFLSGIAKLWLSLTFDLTYLHP